MTKSASRENEDSEERWDLERVLRDELARLRPTFESIVPAPLARKPEKEEEEKEEKEGVSRKLAKKLFEHNLTALCLSGGGIRSASFCLGILQALAQRKLLSRFDYLSTVSGGGYIGSWFSAWRTREGLAKVEESLAGNREPKEVTSLRDFTSYLTPRRGLMSSDTWAGFATVIRNLVLNWTLFLPLLLLLVWVPKFTVLAFQWGQSQLASQAFWLITAAALLYAASELFMSLQMIIAEQQHDIFPKEQQGNSDKPRTYGAGQRQYVVLGLFPAYAAACLASVVLVRAQPAGDDCWAFVSRERLPNLGDGHLGQAAALA